MATVDIIIRMIDQTGGASNKTVANLKQMASQMAMVTAAAAAVGLAMKKAFDLGKEGAMLDFTATKFDRLSKSIGTTSEALMRDLKEATRGTYSDMELMASATDFVALGLAKSHDEAVRLATVSGGLNMNMNQLVLTLTNMTTMRFDALGVSVDGFKEKVKELEKQGYSTEAAFKEAFLQQAEDQLKKVGNAADTTLGSYMRLEAQIKNLTDATKENISVALLPMVDKMVESGEAVDTARLKIELYNREMARTGGTLVLSRAQANVYKDKIEEIANAYIRAEQYGLAWEKALKDTSGTITENVANLEAMTEANKSFLGVLGEVQSAEESYQDKSNSLTQERIDLEKEKADLLAQGWWEQSEKIQEINAKLEENSAAAQTNADEHELANRRIILGLLERKLMQDGVLDDKELQWLLEKGVAWGVYSETVVTETQKAIDEANRLAEAINNIPSEKFISIQLQGMQEARDALAGMAASNPTRTYQSGGRARGGPVSGGGMYEVNEEGLPELLAVGGRQFLMMPNNQSGMVTPVANTGSSKGNEGGYKELIAALYATRMDETKLARLVVEGALKGVR